MKFTKHVYSVAIVFAALLIATPSFAQSKKKLKQMNAQLTTENSELRKGKMEMEQKANSLKSMNEQLTYEMEGLKNDVSALQNENGNLKSEVDELEKENEELIAALESASSAAATGGTAVSSGANMPANSAGCSSRQGKLQNNKTYFVDLSSQIISHGWGVQVYSTKSLCDAQGYAEKFQDFYKMWKTYVKVTEQNGQQIYSVVYGSLKYQDQAKVYLENFKKIGRNDDEKNAILVQH
ncbi:SPOR domain-containing protein [Flammeovirga sp. SubArs3]|uniref:SPOR domain-containing protein n=1 Tax=Flammeovirga sp. SubArs3 TaxID=2995316 RepID=UPI00248B9208|nr:SPOR domain-containing protein [Flammeovirga sp. SubArs3]